MVADNAQFNLANWIFEEPLDAIISLCFDDAKTSLKYKERFNVVDAFEKNNYVPKLYILVNLCSHADNSTQLVPLLERLENMKKVTEYNDIKVILRYEPEKGHDGLNSQSAINFLYTVLEEI